MKNKNLFANDISHVRSQRQYHASKNCCISNKRPTFEDILPSSSRRKVAAIYPNIERTTVAHWINDFAGFFCTNE